MTASALDWNRDYGVDATIGYNDNFRLTEIDPVSTASANLGAFADLQGKTEISSLRFAIGANATSYSASNITDSEKYYLTLAGARQGERWSGTLNLAYRFEPTTETELLDSGNLVDGQRDTYSIAPGISYQLTERSSIYSNLSFSDVTYDTVSFTDYTDTAASLGWIYGISETSDVSINGRYTEYNPEDDETSITSALNLGYDFSTSAATKYSIRLGYSDAETPLGSNRDSDSSFELRHSIDERNGFSLFLGNGYEASSRGRVQYANRLNLRWDHALAERLQFTLTGEGFDTRDRDYQELSAGISHQYTREIRLAARLRYRQQQTDTDNADSASAFVSLSYSPI